MFGSYKKTGKTDPKNSILILFFIKCSFAHPPQICLLFHELLCFQPNILIHVCLNWFKSSEFGQEQSPITLSFLFGQWRETHMFWEYLFYTPAVNSMNGFWEVPISLQCQLDGVQTTW